MSLISIKRFIGHYGREFLVHVNRLCAKKMKKSIVIFPWCTEQGSASSRERAYRLGLHLEKFGWRVLVVPPQLSLIQRLRIVRLEKPKVVFIQKARHILNRPKYYKADLIVFDIDDADFFDLHQVDPIKDCCTGSDLIIAGSSYISDFCRRYNSNVVVSWTGMDVKNIKFNPPSMRQNIVAWGTSDPTAYAMEREFIADVAKRLIKKISFQLYIYGANSSPVLIDFVTQLAVHGIEVKLIPPMSIEDYHSSLESCVVGLHPVVLDSPFSRGKSFGKVNSYINTGVPVVVQNALDYPKFFVNEHNGMLADDVDDWVDKILKILQDCALRDKLSENAKIDFLAHLSTTSVAQRIDGLLTVALDKKSAKFNPN